MPYRIALCAAAAASALASPAHAQWAVIDTPAIAQLVQQVRTMEQALQTARDQLTQSTQTLKAMTGNRGMDLLLRGTARNYLPSNWTQLSSLTQPGSGFPAVSAGVRGALDSMTVLTPPQLAALAPEDREQLIAARRTNAVRLALAQAALANTSARFAAIQSLIAAIAGAGDQKSILDLQARISAEVGMLQNEQTKLQVLHQATEAQALADRQREWEQSIAGQGRFDGRFEPRP